MATPPAAAAAPQKLLPLRPLGATGLRISALGFGASALGGVFDDFAGEEEGIAAVLEAHSLGVNYFDTSPFYGATRSERVLGRALARLPRGSFVVSTKVGRYGESEFDFSAARVRRSLDESLERLGLQRVDLLLAHDVEFGDLDQIVHETLPALQALKREGKCSFVGVTGLPLGALARVVRDAPPGSVDVVLSYCHHCLCDTSLGALLPGLAARGVGVVNASPLSMGLLSARGPPEWHPAPRDLRDACARAAEAASEGGADVSALAVAFSAAREPERVASTLVSMATRALVRANVAAALEGLGGGGGGAGSASSAAAALAAVEACLAPVKDVTWPSGRPENNGLSTEL
jgi:L-galactose dehydrogenase